MLTCTNASSLLINDKKEKPPGTSSSVIPTSSLILMNTKLESILRLFWMVRWAEWKGVVPDKSVPLALPCQLNDFTTNRSMKTMTPCGKGQTWLRGEIQDAMPMQIVPVPVIRMGFPRCCVCYSALRCWRLLKSLVNVSDIDVPPHVFTVHCWMIFMFDPYD